MEDRDSPWKEALDWFFPDFLALCHPEAHAGIEWKKGFDSLDKELQQIVREAELGRRLVDKLFKVWLVDGSEAWVLVHIEVQGQPDPDFAERMFVYYYRLFDRYHVPILSLAVLADDNPSWRPHQFQATLWGCRASLEFPAVKLLDFAARADELEQASNVFGIVLATHLRSQETRSKPSERCHWKIHLVKGLYGRGFSPEQVRELFTIIDWMLELPKELEREFWSDVAKFEEEKKMPYVSTPERIGIEKGREEARTIVLETLKHSLEDKFGPDGLAMATEAEEIKDLAKLAGLLGALSTAGTMDEWRQRLHEQS